jgi:hypothetical protein
MKSAMLKNSKEQRKVHFCDFAHSDKTLWQLSRIPFSHPLHLMHCALCICVCGNAVDIEKYKYHITPPVLRAECKARTRAGSVSGILGERELSLSLFHQETKFVRVQFNLILYKILIAFLYSPSFP